MVLPDVFLKYAMLFAKAGHHLYMIGGTSSDLLLGKQPLDFDFVTDATVEEEKTFLPDFDASFAKFGSIKIKDEAGEVDITTFRVEGEYKDHRHPSSITFVRDMEQDSWRRDFSVNALYIDQEGKVYDFHGGLGDLSAKTLRFIGEPRKRISEDPLRILRAERFAKRLGFTVDEASKQAMDEGRDLLGYLNPEKVKMEKRKE